MQWETKSLHNDKGSMQQKGMTFVRIYAPNTWALKYIKPVLTNLIGEADNNEINSSRL